MTSTTAQAAATEILELLSWVAGLTVRVTHRGEILWEDAVDLEILDVDEAIEWALELAILHDDVLADPSSYHLDTLAAHGVAVPQDHPHRGDLFPPCASGLSADCTGEGTAYAGRCLPCDLEHAAAEEIVHAEAFADGHVRY